MHFNLRSQERQQVAIECPLKLCSNDISNQHLFILDMRSTPSTKCASRQLLLANHKTLTIQRIGCFCYSFLWLPMANAPLHQPGRPQRDSALNSIHNKHKHKARIPQKKPHLFGITQSWRERKCRRRRRRRQKKKGNWYKELSPRSWRGRRKRNRQKY